MTSLKRKKTQKSSNIKRQKGLALSQKKKKGLTKGVVSTTPELISVQGMGFLVLHIISFKSFLLSLGPLLILFNVALPNLGPSIILFSPMRHFPMWGLQHNCTHGLSIRHMLDPKRSDHWMLSEW